MRTVELARSTFLLIREFGLRHALARIFVFARVRWFCFLSIVRYVFRKPAQKTVIRTILGHRMQLHLDDYGIHKELFLYGVHEPKASEHLTNVLAPCDVVLDIGANIGYYTLIEARACRKVYAVEPIRENVQCLKKNIQLSGYTNVEVAELALGDRMGVAPMFMSRRANWHSFYPTHASTGTRNVDMATVDHFVRSRESPTFVRMDVEGFELAILKGMTETLPRLHRLFIEIHADIMRLDDTRDLIARLRTQGFRVQFMVRYDYPGLSRVLPNDHIESVLRGDKGNYEVFFERG